MLTFTVGRQGRRPSSRAIFFNFHAVFATDPLIQYGYDVLTCASTAMLNAPFLNGSISSSMRRVPSGNIHNFICNQVFSM